MKEINLYNQNQSLVDIWHIEPNMDGVVVTYFALLKFYEVSGWVDVNDPIEGWNSLLPTIRKVKFLGGLTTAFRSGHCNESIKLLGV